jgi:SAM-dependent methyltransferase
MAWSRISACLASSLAPLIYPPRALEIPGKPTQDEIEGWVRAADSDHFERADEAFLTRALGLGVSSGMLLDLNSRLGLVAMKILWQQEDLLGMGVYRSLDVAERARHTAEEWGLGDRMFFQVGEPKDLNLKTGYFDLVVSDGTLHTTGSPADLLREVVRISKPGGAILLGQAARPTRFRMRAALSRGRAVVPESLKSWREATLRSGFTRSELERLVDLAGMERTRVVAEGERLFLERSGIDDPASWVTEREKYL